MTKIKNDKKITDIYKGILIDLRLILGLKALTLALWVWPEKYNKQMLAKSIFDIANKIGG